MALKLIVFTILILFSIYILYLSIPEWVGWFAETDSIGIIDSIDSKSSYPRTYIELNYWNIYEDKRFEVSYSADNVIINELKVGDSIEIKYKPFFPSRVTIKGVNYSKTFNDILLLCIFIGALGASFSIFRKK